MYKILQRNTLIELSQIALDLEKQGKTNHIIDQGEKPKLLLIRKIQLHNHYSSSALNHKNPELLTWKTLILMRRLCRYESNAT